MQVQPDVCALTVEASSATIIVRGVPSTWPAISTGYHAGPVSLDGRRSIPTRYGYSHLGPI